MESMSRLQFLWTAAHYMIETCPAISSYYISQIQNDKNTEISNTLLKKFCSHCSTLFIPGVTCKVEVKSISNYHHSKSSPLHNTLKEQRIKNQEDELQPTTPTSDLMNIEEEELETNHWMNENKKVSNSIPIKQIPNLRKDKNFYEKDKIYYDFEDRNRNFRYYKYTNVVEYTCLVCKKVTVFNGSQKSHCLNLPSIKEVSENPKIPHHKKITSTNSTNNPSLNPLSSSMETNRKKNGTNKKMNRNNKNMGHGYESPSVLSSGGGSSSNSPGPSKKRKRNKRGELQQLLSKKNEVKKPKTMSYNLSDFLNNL